MLELYDRIINNEIKMKVFHPNFAFHLFRWFSLICRSLCISSQERRKSQYSEWDLSCRMRMLRAWWQQRLPRGVVGWTPS